MLSKLAGGPFTVREIAKHLKISQSTASQHLLVLKNGKLVHAEKQDQFVYFGRDIEYLIEGLKGWTDVLETKRSHQLTR